MSTAEIGEAYLAIRVDFRALDADLRRMRTVVSNALNGVRSSMSRGFGGGGAGLGGLSGAGGILGGVLAATGVYKLADAVRSLGGAFVDTNAKLEQNRISLGVMLKDQAKADRLLKEIERFAAVTPFRQEGLISSVQLLKQFGYETEKILPMLRSIGDAASASPQGMEFAVHRISLALGQMKAAGKLVQQDLLQLTNVGVPAVTILQEAFKKKLDEIQADVKSGATSMDEVISALLAGMDSRFAGMMEQQSTTFSGLWSTIYDVTDIATRRIGEPFFDLAKKVTGSIKGWLETDSAKAWIERLRAGVAVISKGIEYLVNNPIARWIAAWGGLTAILAGIGVAIGVTAALLAPIAKPLLIAAGFAAILSAELVAIGGAAYALSQTQAFSSVVNWLRRLGSLVAEVAGNIRRHLVPIWDTVAAGVKHAWSAFDIFLTAGTNSLLGSVGKWIERTLEWVAVLTADIPAAFKMLLATAELLGVEIYAAFRQSWADVESVVVGMWAAAQEAAKAFYEYAAGATRKLAQSILTMSQAMESGNFRTMAGAAGATLVSLGAGAFSATNDIVGRSAHAGVAAAGKVQAREAEAQSELAERITSLKSRIQSLLGHLVEVRNRNKAAGPAMGIAQGIGEAAANAMAAAAPIDQQAGEEAAVRRPQFFDLTAWARHAQTALTDNPELKEAKRAADAAEKIAGAVHEAKEVAAEQLAVERGILEGVRRIGFP